MIVRYPRQSGLTLFEVLVVIVLSAMISTLLVQAVGFTLGAYERTKNYQQTYKRELLSSAWIRSSLENIVAVHDERFALKGGSKRIEAYSIVPIFKPPGSFVKISWTIKEKLGREGLWYREDEIEPVLIASWSSSEAAFRYKSRSGRWSDVWPFANVSQGLLPDQIELVLEGELKGGLASILMTRQLRRHPKLDYRDVL